MKIALQPAILLALTCLGASTFLAPVYNPDGLSASKTNVDAPSAREEPRAIRTERPRGNKFVTETVYGFIEFTTTVGSTVMVFTPQSGKEEKQSPSKSKDVTVITATPTQSKIEVTKPPKLEKKTSSSQTTSVLPAPAKLPAPSGLAKLLQEALLGKSGNPYSLSSKPLRHSYKNKDDENKQRESIEYNKRKPSLPGGSTIVPITIEGKGGVLAPKTTILQPSISLPEEIVISASHNFPPISAVGPFKTDVSNDIEINNRYDYAANEPTPSIEEEYIVEEIGSKKGTKPTGLVTTLGGTIISDGQTTIHETSVIGTYVSGKYAQVLKSMSRIFQENPSDNLITPTHNRYETVKAVIEGSATQFFTPEPTASLPIENLFTSATNRSPRYEPREGSPESESLAKRRGTNPSTRDDYYYYYDSKDQFYDDEYDDLFRAGSGFRPTYKPTTTQTSIDPAPTFQRAEPSTFRQRFKSPGTRNIPPSFLRNSPSKKRKTNRFQLPSNNRPKAQVNRRPIQKQAEEQNIHQDYNKYPSSANADDVLEETVRVVTRTPADGPTNVVLEIATLRSLHTYRVGQARNTRHVTYTRTTTHTIEPTAPLQIAGSEKTTSYEEAPLFENILDNGQAQIATLPPVTINGKDLNAMLKTSTETFKTTETLYKTSVLPVKQHAAIKYHTLTQTYLITRIVSAIKTMPPVEAFEFVPSDSLNEFNTKLLAEGTENEAALLPGEQEYDENQETRVPPPPGFKINDANLADLVGGKFNPEALEKQMNPQLAAAIKTHKNGAAPELSGTKQGSPKTEANLPTPSLSPEAIQMAYLQLLNPYMFGGFPGAQPQKETVTSSPVVITTDVTTTSTRVLRVIFNARPIFTTISDTGVVRTTITSYSTSTIQAQPRLPFSFPGAFSFPTG